LINFALPLRQTNTCVTPCIFQLPTRQNQQLLTTEHQPQSIQMAIEDISVWDQLTTAHRDRLFSCALEMLLHNWLLSLLI